MSESALDWAVKYSQPPGEKAMAELADLRRRCEDAEERLDALHDAVMDAYDDYDPHPPAKPRKTLQQAFVDLCAKQAKMRRDDDAAREALRSKP